MHPADLRLLTTSKPMPLQIPSLAETRGLSRDFVAARLAGFENAPANNRARVLSDGNAALAFGAYQYLVQLAIQFLPDTATGEWLDRWAKIWLNGRQAATFSAGTATITGTPGTILPEGSQLAGNGITFETTGEITVGVGPTAVGIQALTAGVVGNLEAGTSLSLLNAVAGVDGTSSVVSLYGGVDVENDDSLRDRILARIRKPPMGGSADDYVAWAREVPGVTRAWCSPGELGPGTVTVRFMMDELRATDNPMTDGFPLAEDVVAVAEHVNEKRPVAVKDVFVFAPVPEPIDFAVSALVVDNGAIRAAIAESVAAMLQVRAAPARAEGGMRVDAQTIHREWVSAAILGTPGVASFTLTMDDHQMPFNGSMAVPGEITFSA